MWKRSLFKHPVRTRVIKFYKMISDEMKPAMQGMVPSTIITCSSDGTPNATVISQVYYVDELHVGISFQFFNKTIRNVRENPHASVTIIHPMTCENWTLDIEYIRSETTGEVFDTMDMQLEAFASMAGMSHVFKLKAADIYRVKSVHKDVTVPRWEHK
jgi:hypothetical protein